MGRHWKIAIRVIMVFALKKKTLWLLFGELVVGVPEWKQGDHFIGSHSKSGGKCRDFDLDCQQ